MRHAGLALAATHLAGNALVLFAFYLWLGTGESDTSHLAASIALILACAAFAACLHGSALMYFGQRTGKPFIAALREAAKHVLPLLLLIFVSAIAYWLLSVWELHFAHAVYVIGSFLTLKFRKPISPQHVNSVFHGLLWVLRWIAIPSFAWPIAARISMFGWSGLRTIKRNRWPLYWMQVCVLLLCAFWAPVKILSWVPSMPNFWAEMASFLLRCGFAY